MNPTYFITAAAVATAYMLQSSLNVVNPIIATIQSIYPNIPYSTIALTATLPTLLAIPGGFVIDRVVKALGHKKTLLSVLLILLVSGLLPLLRVDSFGLLLASRALFGVGYGIGYPLCAMTVIACFAPKDHRRIMGLGTMCVNIGSVLFALLAGVVASIVWYYAFYIHLILLIPFVLALFMKEPPREPAVQSTEKRTSTSLPGRAWLYIIMGAVTTMFFYAFFIYSSAIVAERGLGDSTQAGLMITVSALSGIVAGMIFPRLYQVLRRKVYVASALIAAAAYVCLVFGNSFALMITSSILLGLGFHLFLPTMFVGIGEDMGDASGRTTGLTSSSMNLFSFLATYILTFLTSLIGQKGSMIAPFYFAIGYFVIAAVIVLIRTSRNSAQNKPQQ